MSPYSNIEICAMLYCLTFGFPCMMFKKYKFTYILSPIIVFYFIFFAPFVGAFVVTAALITQIATGEF